MLFLILLALLGLIVGALARLLLPGPDPMGVISTVLYGLAGSFIAGLFCWYVLDRRGFSLLAAILFSILLLWLRRRALAGGGSHR